jgi:hypothetical protein
MKLKIKACFTRVSRDTISTRRTRIGMLMKTFRGLGLIEADQGQRPVIKETRLAEYIGRFAILCQTSAQGLHFSCSAKETDKHRAAWPARERIAA